MWSGTVLGTKNMLENLMELLVKAKRKRSQWESASLTELLKITLLLEARQEFEPAPSPMLLTNTQDSLQPYCEGP